MNDGFSKRVPLLVFFCSWAGSLCIFASYLGLYVLAHLQMPGDIFNLEKLFGKYFLNNYFIILACICMYHNPY